MVCLPMPFGSAGHLSMSISILVGVQAVLHLALHGTHEVLGDGSGGGQRGGQQEHAFMAILAKSKIRSGLPPPRGADPGAG